MELGSHGAMQSCTDWLTSGEDLLTHIKQTISCLKVEKEQEGYDTITDKKDWGRGILLCLPLLEKSVYKIGPNTMREVLAWKLRV